MQYITHETAQGDTFEQIALRYYNDELLAHHIVQENRKHFDVVVFDANIEILVPVLSIQQSNAAKPPWEQDDNNTT